jgi:two-component system sensor histidine kinase ChiS
MSSKQQSILLVDDCQMSRHLLKATLMSAGYQVAESCSGVQCLDFLEHEQPALILLDVMIPDVDGFALLSQIRSRFSADTLPIIMVTGCGTEREVVRGLTSGANDYVTKPIERTTFLARIYNHLSLMHVRKQLDERRDQLTYLLETQRALGDALPEALMVHNEEGFIVYQNKQLVELCRGEELHMAHQVLAKLLPSDAVASFRQETAAQGAVLVERELCLPDPYPSNLAVRSLVLPMRRGELLRLWAFKALSCAGSRELVEAAYI